MKLSIFCKEVTSVLKLVDTELNAGMLSRLIGGSTGLYERKDQSQSRALFWVACEMSIMKLHTGSIVFSFLFALSPGSLKFLNLSANSAELPVAVSNLQLFLYILLEGSGL